METNHELVDTLMRSMMESSLFQPAWVLLFLIGLFVISTLIVAWKAIWFVLNDARARALRREVAELVGGGDLDAFKQRVSEAKGVEARVLDHGLRYAPNGVEVVDQQLEVALRSGRQRMELGLTFLGTVGANAPFIGLFGTVLGIMHAFDDFSAASADSAAAVMSGISEALVATAVGLLVAIPAVVAYNYLGKQVKRTLNSSGAVNEQVLFRLRHETEA